MLPFDPARKLSQLCRRHGLSDEDGARFLVLFERVSRARPDLRRGMLAMIDRQLAGLAEQRAEARRLAAVRDEACLRAVAPLLHGWEPAG
jgi:hypothetical protein